VTIGHKLREVKTLAIAFLITEYTWSPNARTEEVRWSTELMTELLEFAYAQIEILERALKGREEVQP
jgi:hypothetical protein